MTNPRVMRAKEAAAWAATAADRIGPAMVDQLIQQLERNGAQDGPWYAAHTADDQHAQIPDRIHEGKLVDAGETVVVDQQGPGHPGIDTADKKGLSL